MIKLSVEALQAIMDGIGGPGREQPLIVSPEIYAAMREVIDDPTKYPRSQSELLRMAHELVNAKRLRTPE